MILSLSSPAPSSSFVTDAGQPPTEQDLLGSSKNTAVDTHKTIGLDNPKVHGAAAKPLDLYSVSHYADLQQQKINSKNDLIDLIDLVKDKFPCCGSLDPTRFLNVMLSLCESSYQDAFPKNIIGIGSKKGFLEKCFGLMGEVNVKCYDRNPYNEFVPVEQAEFPKDIEKCLPDDCSNCVLVSGYPQGYLGPVLSEFIRRGGEMLCTTVERSLFSDTHARYEDNPDVLKEGIKALRKKNGEFFEVKLNEHSFDVESNEYSIMAPSSYIQFYNWPSSVKQSMFESQELKSLCFDIDPNESS